MIRKALILLGFALILIGTQAVAADRAGFSRLEAEMDAARLMEADVFAPKTWQKAMEAFGKAQEDIQKNKKQQVSFNSCWKKTGTMHTFSI